MNKKSLPEILYNFNIHQFISRGLAEDIGDGDHTSLSCIPSLAKGKAKLLVKENGVIAGVALAISIFKQVDKTLKVTTLINDGALIKKGDIVLIVEGKAQSILLAERLVLNCMQRMSGIATATHKLVTICKRQKIVAQVALSMLKTSVEFESFNKEGSQCNRA